jgi:hypothetical protein
VWFEKGFCQNPFSPWLLQKFSDLAKQKAASTQLTLSNSHSVAPTPFHTMSAPVSATTTTVEPFSTRVAMKWFHVFYQTSAMIDAGMDPIGFDPSGKALNYTHESNVFGAKRYQELLKKGTPEWSSEIEAGRPWSMLSPAAWSFLFGPILANKPHWNAFNDSNTKLRVVVSQVYGPFEMCQDQLASDDDLNRLMAQEVKEHPVQRRPLHFLARGVLTSRNAELFDYRDLEYMATAARGEDRPMKHINRSSLIRAILRSQIHLVKEIVAKNWIASQWASLSDDQLILGLLEDNIRFLEFLHPHPYLTGVLTRLERDCKLEAGHKRRSHLQYAGSSTANKKLRTCGSADFPKNHSESDSSKAEPDSE